ncbi:MAG: methyltransferase [Verrucomicrobiae bacterium]|nr:methyltransferase [Verrucomicrobiae bacterium]
MNSLRRLLSQTGYLDFYLSFGDGNILMESWQQHASRLEDPLRSLVRLFLLQEKLPLARVKRLLGGALLDELVKGGALVKDKGEVFTDKLVLASFNSLLLFFQHVANPRVYFGTDSLALGMYQSRVPGGLTLDLCAGTGIQTMLAAMHAKRSVAVEINPRAAGLARLNARLNNLQGTLKVVNQPLEAFAKENRDHYDLITFNPPLLPVPPALYYPFVGHGGPDGLEVTKRILKLYMPRLKMGGALEFVGCGLGKDNHLLFEDELKRTCRDFSCAGRTLLTGRETIARGKPFYESFLYTAAVHNRLSTDFCHQVCQVHWDMMKANEMCLFFVRIERTAKRQPWTVIDVTGSACRWFVGNH